jgi:hypothetical protein
MNRSVRNGLAIAGMAGGMLFLGQAVASAEVDNSTGVEQEAGSEAAGSEATASNSSTVTNDTDIDVSNEATGGDSNTGNKVAVVNDTGGNDPVVDAASEDEGTVHVSLEIDSSASNTVDVDSGDISDSGNATIDGDAADAPDVTNTTDVDQTATATSDDDEGDHHGDYKGDYDGRNSSEDDEADASNDSDVRNDTDIEVDNDAEGGNTNTGNVVIVENNTGDNDPELSCYAEDGDVYCSITIDSSVTNNITVNSGDICGSGNATIGSDGKVDCGTSAAHHSKDRDAKDSESRHAAHRAAPAKAAPAAHRAANTDRAATTRAALNTTAQPRGQLAFTGAETSVPLTLGLIALGAGGALTLAGRRRTTTAAV